MGYANKMADLLRRSPICVMQILEVCCSTYDSWKDKYTTDSYFGPIWDAFLQLNIVNQNPVLDYHVQDGWLYKLNQLCVPTT